MEDGFDPKAPPESTLSLAVSREIWRAERDWSRTQPSFSGMTVTIDSWRSDVLGPHDAVEEFDATFPTLRLRGVPEREARRLFEYSGSSGLAELRGTIGRRRFTAPKTLLFGRSTFGTPPVRTRVGFQLVDWHMNDLEDARVLVAPVEGFGHVISWSNVRMRELVGLRHAHVPGLRRDLPDVTLVQDARTLAGRLVLSWLDSPPDLRREALTRILRALSFVVGVPVHVRYFVGFDDRGRRAAGCGSLYGRIADFRTIPAPPIYVPGAAWPIPFLRRIIALFVDQNDVPELDIAVDAYLDSYHDHPNTAYLKLVVALEGVAQHVLVQRGGAVGVHVGKNGKLLVAADHQAWKALAKTLRGSAEFAAWSNYVRTHQTAIDSVLGFDRAAEKGWVDGVAKLAPPEYSSLDELPAGKRVLAALQSVGARPDSLMIKESKEWHLARHTGVAPGERGHLESRLELLRGMLVLLIGRWAGYAGPTLGHVRERDHAGRPGAVRPMPDSIAGVPSGFDEQLSEARRLYLDESWDAPPRARCLREAPRRPRRRA